MSLEDLLVDIVGSGHVLVDSDLTSGYETDWTGRFAGTSRCVVRPGDGDETAEVVRVCAREHAAIVPQGGNTGLVGGGVPRGGEVVLSLRRLNSIADVDDVVGNIIVGAGATLGAVQAAAAGSGYTTGIDLAARDSATIGGMIATNAGGMHVLRYGTMREQVIGVEAVLADGSRVGRLPALLKDNTGYSFAALLTGSEGTLGVITRAQIRLVPLLAEHAVALIGLQSAEPLPALLTALRHRASNLHALEFVDGATLDVVREHLHVANPLADSYPIYVLVECASQAAPRDELAGALDSLVDASATAVAETPTACAHLWQYREAVTESLNTLGIPHKLDITVSPMLLPEFIGRIPALIADVDGAARVFMFGHFGDGNVHINVLGPAADDMAVDDAVLRFVAELGGSISAEHGIGIAKTRWLGLTRSDAELASMRAIRTALDPSGILNPGVLTPPA